MDVERVSAKGLLRLRPQGSASPALEQGRAVWIRTCFHCHALDGVGGMVSWDLAVPTPVWSYLDAGRVSAYIQNPRGQDPEAHMPAQHLDSR